MKVNEKEASHSHDLNLGKPNSDKNFWEKKSTDKSGKAPNIVSAIKKDFCKIKACIKFRNYLTLLPPAEAIYWFCFALPMWKMKLVWIS